MIDWDKPIETVDGRKARLVETHHKELWWHLVWAASDYEGPGDVYMVNAEGCRCDSRSIEMGLQTSQFIRNVPVKREGWVRVINKNGLPFSPSDVVFSDKAAAESACQRLGGVPAFVTWDA